MGGSAPASCGSCRRIACATLAPAMRSKPSNLFILYTRRRSLARSSVRRRAATSQVALSCGGSPGAAAHRCDRRLATSLWKRTPLLPPPVPGRSIAALFTVGRLDLGQAALLQEARDEVRVVGGDALALVLGAARMPSEQPSLGTWGPCSSVDLGGKPSCPPYSVCYPANTGNPCYPGNKRRNAC